ncbi:CRISPR system precrRNA processing endoribonuclease RAMP protein Cas6 [Corynebacterium sp. ES2794-CONJ1]|uniref:CRISPR system precrRNA processing endoribonuclease RAMP protein Cas6 n=1 Tax=Corynebacterium sp. ES2794-CONJ1 TaxID=2980553 RepID=UPI0021D90C05|nr:CRISPR system precrRNA processing endoribonuclease RAMP protein Cas6 [Corynebacterium sp. ES2794-CONJ1]MCU9518922.1 CRISPR system precrRNA processing endoribonuclease RAMP protein Cas6 [Corynebacterium sp. ES2794-CONJ1]
MIRVWELLVGPIEVKKVSYNALHAAFAVVLDTEHRGTTKMWSIGRLRQVAWGLAAIRVTTIGDDAAQRLISAWQSSHVFNFSGREAGFVEQPELRAVTSESELVDIEPVKAITVQFHSPTTFRIASKSTPLIEPSRVLHSLNGRWNAIFGRASPGLQAWEASPEGTAKTWDVAVLSSTWVSDIAGKSTSVRLKKINRLKAFQGTMSFNFDSEIAACSFTPLWSLASYIGLGSYTTRGLGDIEIVGYQPVQPTPPD